MPTSTGKTAVIDIAVFHLALEIGKIDRKAPIRIAFVVDRRLVVDDAFERASKISKILQNSLRSLDKPISKLVAESLQQISINAEKGSDTDETGSSKEKQHFNKPLDVVRLRGGMPQENEWVKTPSQPLVIISTIDQVGSRLLFRGYGVTDSMRPIHAGLLASDVLFLLDEVHTSQPFLDTLDKIQEIRKAWKNIANLPFKTLFISATLPPGQKDVFPSKTDRPRLLYEDEHLKSRVIAHKYTTLKKIKSNIVQEFVDAACSLSDNAKNIGIVVNRVDTARRIFEFMKEEKNCVKNKKSYKVHLLIGRARPFDRDKFVKNKLKPLRKFDKQDDDSADITTFFVATQCIEVGVDVSFDALVTQIAPLDSLRQRFGRLNRYGNVETSRAIILASKDDINKKEDDIIYKDRMAKTWCWLEDIPAKDIDFGIKYFEELKIENIEELLAPKTDSVTMFLPYLHFWMQTRPTPKPDPNPALFLHGIQSKLADVQVIWRADVTEKMLNDNKFAQCSKTFISNPSQIEAVSLPIWTVRRWLAGKEDKSTSDNEGVTDQSEEISKSKKVLLYYGKKDERTRIIESDEIHPGATIIVPATYGGCDNYGWNPNSVEPVQDIGIEVNLEYRRRINMRFNKDIVTNQSNYDVWEKVKEATIKHGDSEDPTEFLDELRKIDGLPESWSKMIDMFKKHKKIKNMINLERIDNDGQPRITGFEYKKILTLSDIKKIISDHEVEWLEEPIESETDDAHIESNVKIKLESHSSGVEKFITEFGSKIGIDNKILDVLALVARLHDMGKAEKRIQAFLRNVDPDDLLNHEILAKSTSSMPNNKDDYRKQIKKAHLPKGYRHECWSVAFAKEYMKKHGKSNDDDLVLYLIGTHHGYGKPFFPAVNAEHLDDETEFSFDGITSKANYDLVRLDSDWIDMCERLYKKYGPWNLAYMESVIRLADHRQSEKERYNVL